MKAQWRGSDCRPRGPAEKLGNDSDPGTERSCPLLRIVTARSLLQEGSRDPGNLPTGHDRLGCGKSCLEPLSMLAESLSPV